jgi:hypothetical protein
VEVLGQIVHLELLVVVQQGGQVEILDTVELRVRVAPQVHMEQPVILWWVVMDQQILALVVAAQDSMVEAAA